jgi:phospholipase/lecithinase/hemolysin
MKDLSLTVIHNAQVNDNVLPFARQRFVSFPWRRTAQPTSFRRIISLGDSLTDTGNLFVLNARMTAERFPRQPYFASQRFSNGLLWVEYLNQRLAARRIVPLFRLLGVSPRVTCGVNFAVGRSKTRQREDEPGVPSLVDQISWLENNRKRFHVREDCLFTVWAGSNDYLHTLLLHEGAVPARDCPAPSSVVDVLRETIERLIFVGARSLLVLNLPDLSRLPAVTFLLSEAQEEMHHLCLEHNSLLRDACNALQERYQDVRIIYVDIFSEINDTIANPEKYGFTSTESATNIRFAIGEKTPQELIIRASETCLFWDDLHPTTEAHRVIAEVAYRTLTSQVRL